MNTDADRVAYGYVHSCDTLENRGEAPLPQLTPQLARWVARCSARAYVLWGCKYGDAALAENVCEVIALAARFAVDGWLDEGWRQFSCFSIGQVTGATGWDDDRARRALGACKLDMAPRLSRRGSRFCRELLAKREAPFLAQIKMGKKGQSSTYRFVGIEPSLGPQDDDPNGRPTSTVPKTMGGAEPGIGWCQRSDWVVPTAQLGGMKTGLGGAEGAFGWCDADDFAPPISDGLGGAQMPVMYAAQPISAAETSKSAVAAAPPYPDAFGGADRMPAATPSSNLYISQSLSLSSSARPATKEATPRDEWPPLEVYDGPAVLNDFDEDERRDLYSNDWGTADALLPAEDIPVDPDLVEIPDALAGRKGAPHDARDACYACLTTLFPCPPGIREEETRRQFFARIEAGYRPEDIVDGARKYLASPSVAPSEKWRYPLKWLSDDGAFAAFVRRAPERPLEAMPARERAMAAKFSHAGTDRESMWIVCEKGCMPMEIDCDPGCTVEEARAAFERQLLREQRAECGEEW